MTKELREEISRRADLAAIVGIIPDGARILDLGCGNGAFLKLMKLEKKAKVTGVEIDQANIIACALKGVPVIHADLDEGLKDFSDGSYDFVVLSRTLQAVKRPDLLLSEMVRVGKKGIVSFINLGYFQARLHLLLGKMPVTGTLPDPWYSTPNIHLGTIRDFRELCSDMGIRIDRETPVAQPGELLAPLARIMPNTFAQTSIFIISR